MSKLLKHNHRWFALFMGAGACTLLLGCGDRMGTSMSSSNESSARNSGVTDDDSEDVSGDSTKSSKPKVPKAPKLGAQSADATPAPAPVDCGNLSMHEGQEHCDADDIAAQSELLNTPPPAPVNDKLVEKPADPLPTDKPVEQTPPPPALDPAANGDPNVVVFRIKSGTSSNPWNSEAEMITVKVGQVLRIVNDDTITHRLHTNGAPCPHGVNFGPGASADCRVARAFDPKGNAGPLYDHIAGTKAQFWIKAEP